MVGTSGTSGGSATNNDILEAINKLTNTAVETSENVKFCKSKLETHETQISDLDTRTTANSSEISRILKEHRELKMEVALLRSSNEEIKQHQLKNFIDIMGVPIREGESLRLIVVNIAKVIKVDINGGDILNCYRQGNQASQGGTNPGFYPVIVVEFVDEQTKSDILRGLKELRRPLVANEIGLGIKESTNIFVNEKLTPYLRKVFLEARKAKKDNLIKYVWTKFGKVFGRVNDGTPTLVFTNKSDITAAIGNPGSNDELLNEANGLDKAEPGIEKKRKSSENCDPPPKARKDTSSRVTRNKTKPV